MFYNRKAARPVIKIDETIDTEPARTTTNNVKQKSSSSFKCTQSRAKVEPSVISEGAVFDGNISSPGPIHAQGKIVGELDAPTVTLGKKGSVVGKINCEQLVIDGAFSGQLTCREIAAGALASLEGDIYCDSLTVTPGASINGELKVGKY